MKVVFHLSHEEFRKLFIETHDSIELNLAALLTTALPEQYKDEAVYLMSVEMARVRVIMETLADNIAVIEFDSELEDAKENGKYSELVFGGGEELIKAFYFDEREYPNIADNPEETERLRAIYDALDKEKMKNEWPKIVAIAMSRLAHEVYRQICSHIRTHAIRFVKK
ncbi:hypothetical protein BIZ78_gp054 [Erwinia phage vB_EamM_Caitlin]|uniref:hypothetical protein n=1 Tax=Erwinia phage vB_EamM_Caitlin TaxID=1883379 RepID=UPI00081D2260|nr:hypothetical protein BIZ78_gp054 [Erwinia phage vB_EamM_Caitlin]ANZ48521.1 hypothetical protein CAITLIN_226 [Erwinia phage vB_EamM_Caitlin]